MDPRAQTHNHSSLSFSPFTYTTQQFTTLTHVEDVAALLSSVVDNPKAVNQVFNCATDR